jgi:5-methylcytosine-specific restriction enzyme subunit McrC
LNKSHKHITVFEHESLRIDRGEKRLTNSQLEALQKFYGEKGIPYYSLIHHGVKFGQYVGVIQVGDTIIEILPKTDKSNDDKTWRRLLIGMLHAVGVFDIHSPSSSSLQLKANSILDLYFELYINELEYLIHRGLAKRYRKKEGNTTALKGNIQFAKHLNKNLVHQERFYVRQTTYDQKHELHAILYKALKLLNYINTNSHLSSRLGSLLLDFPEMNDIKVSESIFDRIVLDRKTEPYKNAIQIARLILLNYHPDVSQGTNNVLALMFDMNTLWEQFVYVSLRKYKSKESTLTAQHTKNFWKPVLGNRSKMKPDIIKNKDKDNCVVLDSKWKNIIGYNPSPEDLRQMFVYMKYYNALKVALVYPGVESKILSGTYYEEKTGLLGEEECSIITAAVNEDIRILQKKLNELISSWCVSNENEEKS